MISYYDPILGQVLIEEPVAVQKQGNPFHSKTGTFTDNKSVGVGLGFDSARGVKVRVDRPGHELHGKEGRVVRQQGHDHAVDFGGGQVAWFNAGHLKKI